jgi:asparagine synthetase B (glutamine-hydrolysing)
MCGIAGYITTTKTDYRHSVAVAILAKHMDERGGHSWGAMDASQVIHGLGSINLGLTVNGRMPQQFALHTRYGTTGARVLENSHPFTIKGQAGEVVGMHNGIISNHAQLNRDQNRALVVDSQHIFANISEGRSLDNLEGYGAIVYRVGGDWYIGRFNQGEMKVAMTGCGLFFASTKDALMEALSFAGIAIMKWVKVKDNTVYRLTATGLTKAFKVDAMKTSYRWNDDFLVRSYVPHGITKDATSAEPATSTAPLAMDNDCGCDYCGSFGVDLYTYSRDAVCADCYYEITNEVPVGFDGDSYEM